MCTDRFDLPIARRTYLINLSTSLLHETLLAIPITVFHRIDSFDQASFLGCDC